MCIIVVPNVDYLIKIGDYDAHVAKNCKQFLHLIPYTAPHQAMRSAS
jgi:hypothetical protein